MADSLWPEVRVAQVASEVTVGFVGSMTQEYVEHGVPFLRSLNVEPYRIEPTDLKFISENFHRRIIKSRLTPGDLVVVRTGRPGAAAVIPDDFGEANCSDLVIVRPSEELDVRYLMYYLNSHVGQSTIDARLVGSVQSHFNIGDAKALRLRLPPIPEQRTIAQILGTLDDKIELNRRMNETLEAMARALFKSWFVDFDPVRAKAEELQPAGMDAETTALFPDGFEQSDAGTVPAGWGISSLRSLFGGDTNCVLTGPFGSHLHASDYRESGTPLILVKHVNNGRILEDDIPLVGKHKLLELERYRLQTGDIVFTRVGAVGRSAYVFPRYAGWLISGQMLRVRVPQTGKLNSRYLAQVYSLPSFIDMVEGHAVGSTRPSLNTSLLLDFKLLVPPEGIQTKYAALVAPVDAKVQENLVESATLSTIRDALLPKLLSGEVRVKDTEKVVEEVMA